MYDEDVRCDFCGQECGDDFTVVSNGTWCKQCELDERFMEVN